MPLSPQKKEAYFTKANELFRSHKSVIIANIDSVSSQQLHQVRQELRGRAVMLKSKNTFMRYLIHNQLHDLPEYRVFLKTLVGNHMYFLTNEDVKDIVSVIVANKREAAAKAGQFAPVDVTIPAMVTQLDPSNSSFFISLNVPTRLNKGRVEIVRDIDLIKKGDRVTSSHVALLKKLEINPFFYSIQIEDIFDNGIMFPAEVLDITDSDLENHIEAAMKNFTALSLGLSYPTVCAVPHIMAAAIRDTVAVAVKAEIEIEETAEIREYLIDPSKFAVAPAATVVAAAPVVAAVVAKAPVAAPESSSDSESSGAAFGDIFG